MFIIAVISAFIMLFVVKVVVDEEVNFKALLGVVAGGCGGINFLTEFIVEHTGSALLPFLIAPPILFIALTLAFNALCNTDLKHAAILSGINVGINYVLILIATIMIGSLFSAVTSSLIPTFSIDKAPEGNVLVGIQLTTDEGGISSIQPAYVDQAGKFTKGKILGTETENKQKVFPPKGYGVVTVHSKFDERLIAISLTFMKRKADGTPDKSTAFQSDWIGHPELDGHTEDHGNEDGSFLNGVIVSFMNETVLHMSHYDPTLDPELQDESGWNDNSAGDEETTGDEEY